MKYSEIAHLEKKELWKRFGQLKKQLFESKMQLKMQRLSNPLSLRFLRRDIARIQTALKQAELKEPQPKTAARLNEKAKAKPKKARAVSKKKRELKNES